MKDFIKRFDFLHQNDEHSCGAVSAYMVTANFGVKRSRKWIRYLLKTDFNLGTYQKDLVKALRRFKFKCSVHSFINEFPTALGLQRLLSNYFNNGYLAIACVDDNQHWIVLRALGDNRVYIADPNPYSPKYHTLDKLYGRIKNGSIVFVKHKEEK